MEQNLRTKLEYIQRALKIYTCIEISSFVYLSIMLSLYALIAVQTPT